MPVYKVKFEAQLIGAIGITKFHILPVEADSPQDAKRKLYDTYEHVHIISVTDTATGQTIYVV